MKAAHRTTFTRWFIAASLIGVLPFLGVARKSQCSQKVSDTFNYPQSQETIQVDAEIKSRTLSGVVTDPSGAVASRVLVEKVQRGWGKRIRAVFSDTRGHFAFAGAGLGTQFLRISKPGFNTMLLKVRVTPKVGSKLQIELKLSH